LIAVLETSITTDTWSMVATTEQVNDGKTLLKDKQVYFNRQKWALPPGGKAARE